MTYHQRPRFDQCQADCANHPNCKGFTWIRAGTYNANDAAMCYLLSAVTGKTSARGHYSAVKGTTGGGTPTGYLGCFKDTPDFDVKGSLERSRTNTLARCIESCRQKGFAYAAVQYGESCLCGNSYGKYGRADNCNYRCTGDPNQICGGYNANSIYATGAGGGGCKLEGSWKQTTSGGSTTWKITNSGQATEDGGGSAKGTATLTGRTLRINWEAPSGYAGYYEWTLNESCAGSGTLVFTRGGSGSHKSTVNRPSNQ